ncbi:hypothetical protein [Brevundimonas sp. DWP1b2]|uniref:hypothetical protein n=1 Tax=unclassified Brevundimonas TaxID=2622653 RepID=UPI003CF0AD14
MRPTFGGLLYAVHRMRRSLIIALGAGAIAALVWGFAWIIAAEFTHLGETHVSNPSAPLEP